MRSSARYRRSKCYILYHICNHIPQLYLVEDHGKHSQWYPRWNNDAASQWSPCSNETRRESRVRGWCAVYSRRWKWVTAATTVARMNRGWKCIRVHRSQVKRAYLAEYFLSLAPWPCIIFQRVQRRFLAQFSTNSFPLFSKRFPTPAFPASIFYAVVFRPFLSTGWFLSEIWRLGVDAGQIFFLAGSFLSNSFFLLVSFFTKSFGIGPNRCSKQLKFRSVGHLFSILDVEAF